VTLEAGMDRRQRFTIALLLGCCAAFAAAPVRAQGDALDVQARAIARIDAVIDRFRRTGDLRMSELAQAGADLDASNRVLESRADGSALARGLIKRGHVSRIQTKWQDAIALYERALHTATQVNDVLRQADALTWLAFAQSSSRNYGAASANATRAVRLAEKTSDRDLLADALDVLGTVQIAQLDLAGAAETLTQGVAAAAAAKDPVKPYYAYLSRSDVHLKRAERCDFENAFQQCYDAVDRARADLQQALGIVRTLGYAALAQQTEGFLQNVESRRALIKSREASVGTIDKAGLFRPKDADDVLVTERFLPPGGPLPPALTAVLEVSREMNKAAGGYGLASEARNHYVEGLAHEMAGNHEPALTQFLAAIDAVEADRRSLRDERSRGTFMEDRISFYYAAIQQLLERRQYDRAFHFFERSRSRSLADLLASRSAGLGTPPEQKLFADLMVLRTRIGNAQGRIFELVSEGTGEATRKEVVAIQDLIRTLEAEHQQLTSRIERESPRLAELVTSAPATLQAVQQALRQDGSELLQYLVLDHAVLLWHISPQSVTVKNVFLPRSEVIRKTSALRASLDDRNAPFDKATAEELFLYLIAPALPDIRSDRLVIVPHEDLQYVPFQVFLDPRTGRFAGERFQLTYVPSASVLLGLRPSPGLAEGRLLAVGDPDLDAAGEEVEAIARHFPGRNKVLTTALPSESDVKSLVGQFDVIHLAVHGRFDANEPMLSSLSLAKGGADDGQLTAAEMFGLPLSKSRLVVLSACETGRARATHANEVLGMLRGLLYAGASTLVLSHWEVDSVATARWMETFYDAARSRPVAEAARAAMIAVKNTPEYAHPYYWAAFTVVGR
jgi:CHAT domain-containing protein